MKPVTCRERHDPASGRYGDCVRACVASIMEFDAEAVPHFYHDNCDGETGFARIREFLATHNFAPFATALDGSNSLDAVLEWMGDQNPGVHYLLFGRTAHGEHVVVCHGGTVVHDPAWSRSPIIKPTGGGYWTLMVLARA